jgi:hypothetical protein
MKYNKKDYRVKHEKSKLSRELYNYYKSEYERMCGERDQRLKVNKNFNMTRQFKELMFEIQKLHTIVFKNDCIKDYNRLASRLCAFTHIDGCQIVFRQSFHWWFSNGNICPSCNKHFNELLEYKEDTLDYLDLTGSL